jgi:glycosyltransferase involved in cell wall biosynthesis
MKLLMVNKLYAPQSAGGAETITQALAEAHQRRGIDVTVATTTEGEREETDEVNKVPVVRLPLRNFFWHQEASKRNALARAAWHARDAQNRAMGSALGRLIQRVQPDLIAFHNLSGFSASAWGAARRARKPALQVLHDYYHLCPRSQLFAQGRRCKRQCTDCALFRIGRRAQSNRLQAVVGVSRAVLDAHVVRGLFDALPLRSVIHNALSRQQTPQPSEVRVARVFGYLGTLGEFKGIVPLLRAFKTSLRTEPGLRLRVAGRGDAAFVEGLNAVHHHPSIEFLGHVQSVDFLRSIDALIVPSLWDDPLPTVIIEALNAGVPVIGARRGGIPEMIRHGSNGLLYEPSRPDELDHCILRLSREPALLSKLRSGCTVTRSFSDQDRMAAGYERVYERLCQVDA